MKRSLCLLFGVLVVTCAGCGGADGSSAYAATPVAQEKKSVLIEAYGDSTTKGYTVENGVSGINPKNQIAVLQDLLQQRFGNSVTVSNQGVGSTEASQLLNGTDGQHSTWAQQMSQSKANIITIEYGLNDAYFFASPTDGVEPESPERFEQILVDLINTARAAGKQVVLIEPGPSCNSFRQPTLAFYVMRVDNVAKNLGVPLVPHYWSTVATPDWQSLLSDCTHPTTQLYAAHAKSTFDVIQPLVEKLAEPTSQK